MSKEPLSEVQHVTIYLKDGTGPYFMHFITSDGRPGGHRKEPSEENIGTEIARQSYAHNVARWETITFAEYAKKRAERSAKHA